jgi:hypothetical protein
MAFTKVLGPGIGDGNQVIVGIITATAFYGDGSNLDGITSAGLGTAVEAESVYGGEQIYYTNTVLGIGGTVTVDLPDSTNVAYTQYVDIAVDEDADLIIGDGDDLVLDILGIGTESSGLLPGNGGRVRADTFTNKAGTGAPNFPNGLSVGDGSFTTGFLEIPNTLNVSEDKTISGSSTSKVIVQQQAVVVDSTKSLILGPDAELVINAFQI